MNQQSDKLNKENQMENRMETINGMLSDVIGYISQAEAVVREIEKQLSPPSVTSPEGEIIADTVNNMLDEAIGCIRRQAKKL